MSTSLADSSLEDNNTLRTDQRGDAAAVELPTLACADSHTHAEVCANDEEAVSRSTRLEGGENTAASDRESAGSEKAGAAIAGSGEDLGLGATARDITGFSAVSSSEVVPLWVQDAKRHARVEDWFHELVRNNFKGALKAPFNDEARARAGFTESWYLPLSEDKYTPP